MKQKSIPELRKSFMQVYSKLSEKIKDSVIIYMNNEPCSWRVVKIEAKGKTPLGRKMLGNLHERKKI